jgi:hypothetical protein
LCRTVFCSPPRRPMLNGPWRREAAGGQGLLVLLLGEFVIEFRPHTPDNAL